MTRQEIEAVIQEEASRAKRPDGTFDYEAFGAAMKARAPSAWETEHFCIKCGAPARFGFGVSISEGRLGEWRCRDHWLL